MNKRVPVYLSTSELEAIVNALELVLEVRNISAIEKLKERLNEELERNKED